MILVINNYYHLLIDRIVYKAIYVLLYIPSFFSQVHIYIFINSDNSSQQLLILIY